MKHQGKNITIVGGGIVGVCCALSLLEKGLHVRLIDEGDLTRKASYGNAGVISPWSCVPQSMPGVWKQIPKWIIDRNGPVSFRWSYLTELLPWAIKFLASGKRSKVLQISTAMDALNRQNVELYRQHLVNTGFQDLIKDACYLHVYRNKQNLSINSLEYRLRSNKKAPLEIINAEQIKEIEPAISDEFQTALLIKGQARALSPGRLVQVLTEKFRKAGGELALFKLKRVVPDESAGWQIVGQSERYQSDLLVIAAGAWSVDILKPLGFKLPLINERGYYLEFHNPNVSLNHSIMDVESKFVVSSMSNGIRSAGTAEFAQST